MGVVWYGMGAVLSQDKTCKIPWGRRSRSMHIPLAVGGLLKDREGHTSILP